MQKKTSTTRIIKNTDVLILCGGKGTRLKKVIKECPKPMAIINGRPFLDFLIDYISQFSFRRLILCTGYKSGVIKKYYQNKKLKQEIIFSNEKIPLGTAGAVRHAEKYILSDNFIIMNGDSFCPVDLRKVLKYHFLKAAHITMVVTKSKSAEDYGAVVLDRRRHIVKFEEKKNKPDHNAFVNAGIYVFRKNVLKFIPEVVKYSLENELFPKIVDKEFYGYKTVERMIDIGTPKRYENARKYFERMRKGLA